MMACMQDTITLKRAGKKKGTLAHATQVKHPRIQCGGLRADRTSQRKALKGNCETSLSKLWQQGI